MMAVMMLPAVWPVAARYAALIGQRRPLGVAAFGVGYLAVWTVAGVPAWLLVLAAARLSAATSVRAMAAVACAACGLYQFTGLKRGYLARCRVPPAMLLTDASWTGPLRHLRVGAHHGASCVVCCWPLFVLLMVAAPAGLVPMLAVVAIVVAERQWKAPWIPRAVGVLCVGLAIALLWSPRVARVLEAAPMPGMVR
jgi:predicted metal-binding membrane protein